MDLARRKPGKIYHAHWLSIAAIRILRLYVSSSETSQNFKDIAIFVIKVYDPCIHGPQNILRMITFFGYLPQHQKEVINIR
jgi:hypothetical protein